MKNEAEFLPYWQQQLTNLCRDTICAGVNKGNPACIQAGYGTPPEKLETPAEETRPAIEEGVLRSDGKTK